MSDAPGLHDGALPEPPRATRPAAHLRLGLVGVNYAYRLVAGLLIARPIAALVQGAVANDPQGDIELFAPGGVVLLDALRLAGRGAAGAVSASGFVGLVVTFAGLLPFAALVAGLGRQGRLDRGYLAARAVERVGTLALLWGLCAVAQVVLAVLLGLIGGKILDQLHLGRVGEDIGYLVVGGVSLLGMIAAGVIRDLAAVSAVNDGTLMYTSAQRAFRVALGRGGRVAVAYALPTGLAVALALAGSYAVLALGAPGSAPLALPFLIHQLVIAAFVFLHATWLASAIRLLDDVAPLKPPGDVAEPPPAPPSVHPAPAAPPAPEEPAPINDERRVS